MAGDASATYRGYRKQALYVLWRLLTDADSGTRSYRPEGEEDLAVFDASGALVEAVQVKDYTSPLTLSDLRPDSPVGFFARLKKRSQEHPACRHVLASFGPIGVELAGAINGVSGHRTAVTAKLSRSNPAASPADTHLLLDSLKGNVTQPDEPTIRSQILVSLADTIGGVHPETAIELLQYWVFEASERRDTITRTGLLQQLDRIGEYVAGLRDHSTEWMVSLRPLSQATMAPEECERLRDEYRRGVQARWNHILAAADSPRPRRLAQLHEKMTAHAAVVVRGASGQGKSSLAFRYLHDYVAEKLRFHVRFVEGRTHAARVANALRGHVRSLRLRAVVLLDLSPSDTGWGELVRELTEIGLKVLVTVREEDFRRVGSITPDVDIDELSLDAVERDEAKGIYDELTSGNTEAGTLDFDEAWARFTSLDTGPLLEFTHLVSAGQTLNARIDGQISRLQAEAASHEVGSRFTTAHLRLLTLAAVANAAECRLKLRDACEVAGLDPLARPLAVLEDEYLVRVCDDGAETTIAGLHPLRSHAMERALLHDCPELWGELAVACLHLVLDEDTERFLLVAFSRRPEHSETLQSALRSIPMDTWTRAGGVGRALLWDGVSRYERENHDTVSAALAEHQDAWWLLCDPFVGLPSETMAIEATRKTIEDALKQELPRIPLTPKQRVFDPLRAWCSEALAPDAAPASGSDWCAAGDLAFWLGTIGGGGPLRDRLLQFLPEPLPKSLPLPELARFISGREALGDSAFTQWHTSVAYELAREFVRYTRSIYVVDENDEIKVLFPVIVAGAVADEAPDEHDLHTQAMKRIELLRQLFPGRAKFCSQGLGVEPLAGVMQHDPTIKEIPAESLAPDRSVQLNSIFIALVDYRHRRASSWNAYTQTALDFRRAACDCFRELHRAWGRLLEEAVIQPRTILEIPGAKLDRLATIPRLPLFPRTAVDEWGFVSEVREKANSDLKGARTNQWGNLRRFQHWLKVWARYESGVSNVGSRTLESTMEHVARKSPHSRESSAAPGGQLLLENLRSSWAALAPMQAEFRHWFGRYVPAKQLDELDSHERATFRHLGSVTEAFVESPLNRVIGGASSLEAEIKRKRENFLRRLRDGVGTTMAEHGTVRISEGPHTIGAKACLLVLCDHFDIASTDAMRYEVVRAIRRAAGCAEDPRPSWTPLAIEWPHIFVGHILRGKALHSAGTHLDTQVLFASGADAQVSPHHVYELPVSASDFDAAGIKVWESPLLTAAVAFQGSLSTFVITMTRFESLIEIASKYTLSSEDLEFGLKAFSQEMTNLRRLAADHYDDLANLLHALGEASHAHRQVVDDWLGVLDRFCGGVLFTDGPSSEVTISLTVVESWAALLHEQLDDERRVIDAIIDVATCESPSDLPPATGTRRQSQW